MADWRAPLRPLEVCVLTVCRSGQSFIVFPKYCYSNPLDQGTDGPAKVVAHGALLLGLTVFLRVSEKPEELWTSSLLCHPDKNGG